MGPGSAENLYGAQVKYKELYEVHKHVTETKSLFLMGGKTLSYVYIYDL